jgi:hypothetical protein
MRAIGLPNGNLLIPVEEPDVSDDGDSRVEIMPDDPAIGRPEMVHPVAFFSRDDWL